MASTIVVTGGSSGIGLAAAKQFAARGDDVILVGRDPHRLTGAVTQIRQITGREPAHFRTDFESFAEVRALATELLAAYPTIDVLANNAGGMIGSYRRTADGCEATIQSNHLSPFLLTTLLRDRVKRIVNTASRAHAQGRPDPGRLSGDRGKPGNQGTLSDPGTPSSPGTPGTPGKYSAWQAYGAAKSANILFTAEAARRWPDIISVCFHPGVVRSNFGDGTITRLFFRFAPFLVTPDKAGELLVRLATTPAGELVNGGYYVDGKPARPAPHAGDATLAAELWEASTAVTRP